jgi:hypothetical protein
MNDRVEARLRSLAVGVPVRRLRQPIDTERFLPGGPLPAAPSRALLLSNNPSDDRWRLLEGACEAAGMSLTRVGGDGRQSADVRAALADADVVIGYGRSILEAMACGRAAYVYDWNGGEGWVTPETYAAIEADGIAGRSGREVLDRERLAADLRSYDLGMGPVNRDLVIAHHRANVHAQELVGMLRSLGAPRERPRGPFDEMARLVRMEWRTRGDVYSLRRENEELRQRLRTCLDTAEERAIVHGRVVEEQVRSDFERTLSWRVTGPLRALSRARARRRR